MNEKTGDRLQLVMIQANPTVGAIDKNFQQILDFRRQYQYADLIVLSECFLTGYPLDELVSLPHFIATTTRALGELAERVRAEPGPAVLIGAPTAGADKPYNSAILIRADGTTAVAHKQELPNSDVFDEMRTFAQGSGKAQPLKLDDNWKLGVMICEDGWHKKVAADLEGEGADILIAINGSPCRLGKQAQRLTQMRRRASETRLPVVYVNQVGGQDELIFDGASFVLDATGETLAKLAFMEADALAIDIVRDSRGKALIAPRGDAMRGESADAGDAALLYRAGVLGLRDYADKNGVTLAHIGISGGADSALVAAMAADALGADRVRGYRLPSSLTGSESMELAEELLKNLGIPMETVTIADAATCVTASTRHIVPRHDKAAQLAHENLQARLRMVMLMHASNAAGGMLLGTSNKSESSVGYTTIYGDMAGQYNPIKDLYKTDVWAAMRWRNGNVPADSRCTAKSPIPEAIIARPPSAELAEGQTDEASLGSYETLDPILKNIIERQLDAQTARIEAEALLGTAIDPAYAVRISDLIYQAEFKRRQACIGPQLRVNSFGLARRYPVTNQFREERQGQ